MERRSSSRVVESRRMDVSVNVWRERRGLPYRQVENGEVWRGGAATMQMAEVRLKRTRVRVVKMR